MQPGPFPPYQQQPNPQQQPYQQQWAPAPPPPTNDGTAKILAFGCLGLVVLTLVGIGAAGFLFARRVAGTSLASTAIAPGASTRLTYSDPGRGPTGAWLEVDVTHTQGFRVMGMFTVVANNQSIAQYNLNGDLSGPCANPTVGQTGSFCMNWNFTQSGAGGSVSGRTRLFTIPPQPSGTAVSIVGTLYLGSGATPRQLTLNVRD